MKKKNSGILPHLALAIVMAGAIAVPVFGSTFLDLTSGVQTTERSTGVSYTDFDTYHMDGYRLQVTNLGNHMDSVNAAGIARHNGPANDGPIVQNPDVGFRVAAVVPERSSLVLAACGAIGLIICVARARSCGRSKAGITSHVKSLAITTVLFCATIPSPARAALTVYTARPAFQLAAAATPASISYLESFETNAPASGSPQVFPGFTVSTTSSFLNNEILPGYATDGAAILTFDSADTVTLTFDAPTYAWGSDIIDLGNPGVGPNSMFASDSSGNNVTLALNHSGPQASSIFRGVVSTTPFTWLAFTFSVGGDSVAFDLTEVKSVPEPSGLVLAGCGALGLIFCRARRRTAGRATPTTVAVALPLVIVMLLAGSARAAIYGEAEAIGLATNNSVITAEPIAPALFTSPGPATVFHPGGLTATVEGHGGGSDVDFYSFATPGAISMTFDIDNIPLGFDSIVSLFDSAGTLIAFDDDSFPPDAGSNSTGLDAFVGTYILPGAGTYYVAVSQFANFPTARSTGTHSTLTRPDGAFGGVSVAGATFGDSSFQASGIDEGFAYTLHMTVVPEPSSLALLGFGAAAVGLCAVRRTGRRCFSANNARRLCAEALALATAILLCGSNTASAITPLATGAYPAPVASVHDMESDTDSYTPTDNNPLGDPALAGETPGAQPSHLGGPPDNFDGQDWFDHRNGGELGGSSILEEVPSGFFGVPSPDGSAHFAINQFEDLGGGFIDGGFGRQGRQSTLPAQPYYVQAHVYINPTQTANTDGVPDFWWTNGIQKYDGINVGGSAHAESGLTGTIDPSSTTWSIATTAGVPVATVPVGIWTLWEVEPIEGPADSVWFQHRVWDATRSTLLGFVDTPDVYGTGLWSERGGPRFTWFTFAQENIPYLYLDNIGWRMAPEPSGLALAACGFGGLGLLVIRRRRQLAMPRGTMRFVGLMAAALLCTASWVSAATVTMDFESFAHGGTSTTNFNLHVEDGFMLSYSFPNGLGVFGTGDTRYPGSTAAFIETYSSINSVLQHPEVTRVGGGPFQVSSVALTKFAPSSGFNGTTVTVDGIKADSTILTHTFSVSDTFGLATYVPNFAGVDIVKFVLRSGGGGSFNTFYQWDDIVLTPVPEPSSAALAVGAIGALIAMHLARRRGSVNRLSSRA